MNMPTRELDPTPELVARLLGDQHPDLADLPLVEFSRGWDNTMFRLGSALTVRLPHRASAADLIDAEQRWLPVIDQQLPLPVPTPIRIGHPTDYYPWRWSVLPWFDGTPAWLSTDLDRQAAATTLGRFQAALHTPAPADAPANHSRGVPLSDRHRMTVDRIDGLTDGASSFSPADRDRIRQRWDRYRSLPPWDGPPIWLHGDLHGMNLLCHRGLLSAVIDFGDITSGDPATDLAIGFSMFEATERAAFRTAADSAVRPIDDATWGRAEGWAMSVGLAIVHSSADSPTMFELGRRMIGH